MFLPNIIKTPIGLYRFTQKASLVILIICSTLNLHGQAPFILNGNALTSNDSCYQLTADILWEVGSIWNSEKVDLNESFLVTTNLFLGCEDNEGADGIVFGLQSVSTTIGTAGGDIGFGEVQPSIGVEFDTYQNVDYEDPIFDHIAIIQDGQLRHNVPNGTLAGPVQANEVNSNIEDCEYHQMEIRWDADIQTLSVYFDCELRLTYTGDIVNEIFNGDPLVFWGFTSATGGLSNVHEVCLSYTTFLNELVDQTICPGTELQLEASGGTIYQWSPIDGLSDPTIANPIAAPAETTLYTVEIENDCGIVFSDDVLITIDNEQFEVELLNLSGNESEIALGDEITLSANVIPDDEGDYTFNWSSTQGSIFTNASNNLVDLTPSEIGTETITVQVISEDGCIGEATISLQVTGPSYAIPNAFTPDGDGINDLFGVITEAELLRYHCKIFNRWGAIVFESNNGSEFWDGRLKGKASPSDVFVYLINFEIGNTQFQEQGDLTLIR